MSELFTRILVLPFALIAMAFDAIMKARRTHQLNQEVYAYNDVEVRRGDRVVTGPNADFGAVIEPDETGHDCDILFKPGKTGMIQSGRGGGGGVNVLFDAQRWTDRTGATVWVPAFVHGLHMEYLMSDGR